MNTLSKKAIKYFRHLAAGVPHGNLIWGKSKREIIDYYLLAAIAIEEKIERDGNHEDDQHNKP